jgi:hypothetical protein
MGVRLATHFPLALRSRLLEQYTNLPIMVDVKGQRYRRIRPWKSVCVPGEVGISSTLKNVKLSP